MTTSLLITCIPSLTFLLDTRSSWKEKMNTLPGIRKTRKIESMLRARPMTTTISYEKTSPRGRTQIKRKNYHHK